MEADPTQKAGPTRAPWVADQIVHMIKYQISLVVNLSICCFGNL